MKTKFVNEVTLTLRVSNDTERRPAVYKVSDKLTTVKAYLNTGKDQSGNYNPAIDFEVQIFTANAKTPTNCSVDIKPGDYINVTGRLTSRKSTNASGKEFKNNIIAAFKIEPPEIMEDDGTILINTATPIVPEDIPIGFEPINEEENPWN